MFKLAGDGNGDKGGGMNAQENPARKTALVTGAASGIGAAAVLALARAGYDVAINYSRSDGPARAVAAEAAQKLGAKTLLCKCDVADDAGVRAMLKHGRDRLRPARRAHQQCRHHHRGQAQGFRGA